VRALPAEDAKLYSLPDRSVLMKVLVGGQDLTKLSPYNRDWVESFTYSGTLDQPLVQAELRVRREEYLLSLSPLNANSRLNNITGSFVPVISLNSLVVVSVAVVPVGHDRNYADTFSLWREVFRGRIDSWDESENPMVVRCRDISCEAQDLFIERQYCYAIGKQRRGVEVWTPGTAVVVGDWCVPTQLPELGTVASYIYNCVTAGTTGTSQPTWPTSGTVNDGTAQWMPVLYGTSGWAASTSYNLGDAVLVSGHRYLAVPLYGEASGVTNSSAPTWPTTVGQAVDDGGVRWIMVPDNTDGGMSIEAILGGMLFDNTTKIGITTVPAVWTPTTPGYWRNPMIVAEAPLLEAMRALAQEIGWDVRLRWSPGSLHSTWGSWRLCLSSPDRAKTTPDVTLSDSEYTLLPRVESSLSTVRNVVRLSYSDPADLGPDGAPRRKTVTASDAASIAKYGRRFCGIAAGSSNNINSGAEATLLANAILSDVSDPGLEVDVETGYRWNLELADLVGLAANWYHFTADQQAAVYGYSHTLSRDRCTTRLQLRGKPAIGVMRWLEIQSTPGIAQPSTGITPPGPIKGSITVTDTVKGAVIKYKPPRQSTGKPPVAPPGPGEWGTTELHLSTSSSFTPSSSTLVAQGRTDSFVVAGRTPGVLLYGRLVLLDGLGNRSSVSDQFVVLPAYVVETDLSANQVALVSAGLSGDQVGEHPNDIIEFDAPTIDTVNGFDAGTFEYVVPIDGVYRVRCHAGIEGLASGDVSGLQLELNGSSTVAEAPRATVAGDSCAVLVEALLELQRGDSLQARLALTTNSGSITVLAATSSFEVQRLLSTT